MLLIPFIGDNVCFISHTHTVLYWTLRVVLYKSQSFVHWNLHVGCWPTGHLPKYMETPAYRRWRTQLPGILCLFTNGQVCPQNVFVLRWSRPCQNLRSASEWTTQAAALRSQGPVNDCWALPLVRRQQCFPMQVGRLLPLTHGVAPPCYWTGRSYRWQSYQCSQLPFTATVCHIDSDVGFAVSGRQYPLFGVAWKCGANFPLVITIEVGHAGPKLPPSLIPKPVNQFNKEYQTPHPLY